MYRVPDRGFPCFPSVVRRMLGYSSQRRGTVRTLTSAQRRVNGLLNVLLVLTVVVVVVCNFWSVIVYHCHRVYTQLQLNKYHIISNI